MLSMNRITKLISTTTRINSTTTTNNLRTFSTTLINFNSAYSPKKEESDLTHPALMKDPPITNPSTETDPWSLAPPPAPDVNEDGSDLTIDELILSPHPEGRDNESTETLRKRLVYESRKRGILEMDLILATFAQTRLADLTDRELREYDRFLTLPDWSLYYYVTNKSEAPHPWKDSWILNALLDHSKNKGRTVRRMPDLEIKK